MTCNYVRLLIGNFHLHQCSDLTKKTKIDLNVKPYSNDYSQYSVVIKINFNIEADIQGRTTSLQFLVPNSKIRTPSFSHSLVHSSSTGRNDNHDAFEQNCKNHLPDDVIRAHYTSCKA